MDSSNFLGPKAKVRLEYCRMFLCMENNEAQNSNKKRSLTELTLGWLAEKIRRSEEIKQKVHSGTYLVDSNKIAESIVKPES